MASTMSAVSGVDPDVIFFIFVPLCEKLFLSVTLIKIFLGTESSFPPFSSSLYAVMYVFDEYKVHSNICLITLRNANHIHHILQVGTGNYNEKTAKLYTDLCLMSANKELAEDAFNFFNNMAQDVLDGNYNKLLVAPNHLKDQIIKMIDEQIALKDKGYIFMKLNSLSDIDIIDKFVEASQAQVKIDLIVRGICCLIPGVSQKTENINIYSIVGRYLEHARIYVFGKRGHDKVYIASADMMTRNTENRVEVAAPILQDNIKKKMAKIYKIYK